MSEHTDLVLCFFLEMLLGIPTIFLLIRYAHICKQRKHDRAVAVFSKIEHELRVQTNKFGDSDIEEIRKRVTRETNL